MCDFQRGYEAAATVAFGLASGVEMIGIVEYAGAAFMACNPGCQSLEQHVIGRDHTVEHMRGEHYFPSLFNRDAYDVWRAKGAKSLVERAREKLSSILRRTTPRIR